VRKKLIRGMSEFKQRVEAVLKKYPIKLLGKYFETHSEWYEGFITGPSDKPAHTFLRDHKDILQTLWPLTKVPKLLYRGMGEIQDNSGEQRGRPQKGEPVFHSNKFKYVTS
jgi:hypothetical protein